MNLATRILCALLLAGSPSTDLRAEEGSYARAYEILNRGPEVDPGHTHREGIAGRVLCGYQGWFRAEGDGADQGWHHYDLSVKGEGRQFRPGNCSIDLWPDMREMEADERFATSFNHADGSVAEVFSSQHPKTVDRHFQWMADYGIDGAFVQRFAVVSRPGRSSYSDLKADNRKLLLCRDAALKADRAWALMYDLSGVGDRDMPRVFRDWKELHGRMAIGTDASYLHHKGRPLVAIWGAGFAGDKRRPSVKEVLGFVRFLRENPEFGGYSVMLGVPTGWRERERDCIDDPDLDELFAMADILSPWSVGRYHRPEEVGRHAEKYWRPDGERARELGADYLPVVFPGFSWHNHERGESKLDLVPRLGGRFLWKQFLEAKGAGAQGVYVAMFDEMDEGTAIFKCTNDPPAGKSPFLDYEGLPSDHYLWLCGEAGKLLREELPARGR